MQKKYSTLKKGFTLIELLVVVAIVSLLTLTVIFTFGSQRTKAEDSQMKTDLNRLKTAFEDYYNDHNCYPPSDWFNGPEDAGSENLKPYLNQMLYNKKTDLPYVLSQSNALQQEN
jgi:prepilin-type N-terminal cleavage/methylation domain-containing protein